MLGPLSLPPRLAKQALDDLSALAEAMRALSARDGDLAQLVSSVRELPRVEDELSAQIAELRVEVRALHEWLRPLHQELQDVDETCESLEKSLDQVNESIVGLQGMLKKLPGI